MKKAFTIVELMVVVTIIAILMTLVFSAYKGSMVAARTRRAEALCQALQAGLASYHAQYDAWPEPLGNWVKNDSIPNRSNQENPGRSADPTKFVLEPSEVRQVVRALVDEAKKGNPLMDISGLYVSRSSGESGGSAFGMDFISAVRGTSRSKKKMTTSEMYFGYPDPATGRFRRFKMVYSIPADALSVSQQ